MLKIIESGKFKKDWKRCKKRGCDLDAVKLVIAMIVYEKPLPAKYKDHKLSGNYAGRRDCHVETDLVLIYKLEKDLVIFERLGTHSDLF